MLLPVNTVNHVPTFVFQMILNLACVKNTEWMEWLQQTNLYVTLKDVSSGPLTVGHRHRKPIVRHTACKTWFGLKVYAKNRDVAKALSLAQADPHTVTNISKAGWNPGFLCVSLKRAVFKLHVTILDKSHVAFVSSTSWREWWHWRSAYVASVHRRHPMGIRVGLLPDVPNILCPDSFETPIELVTNAPNPHFSVSMAYQNGASHTKVNFTLI